jgi:DNA-binding phage protein
MDKTVTRTWNPSEYLTSDQQIAAYLDAALEADDAALFSAALGDAVLFTRL